MSIPNIIKKQTVYKLTPINEHNIKFDKEVEKFHTKLKKVCEQTGNQSYSKSVISIG